MIAAIPCDCYHPLRSPAIATMIAAVLDDCPATAAIVNDCCHSLRLPPLRLPRRLIFGLDRNDCWFILK